MLSYWRGPEDELWELTIAQVLDRAVERWGDSLALVSCHQSKRYTWRELRAAADGLARGLVSLGIHPGDRVGLCPPTASSGCWCMWHARGRGRRWSM
jgi:fatty-acyl-CoA synthase